MPVPQLLTTSVSNESFGGVTYHIEGELVPRHKGFYPRNARLREDLFNPLQNLLLYGLVLSLNR